jgi:nucleolin
MASADESKVFVAGLSQTISDESLKQVFTSAGLEVTHLAIPRDRETGVPRGFAFVTLGSKEQALDAIARIDGSFVAGRSIRVRPFSNDGPSAGAGSGGSSSRAGGYEPRSHGDSQDNERTLYMSNLPYEVREPDIRALFSEAAAPSPRQVHIPVNPDGRARGFAFVNFDTSQQAREALDKVPQPTLGGRRCNLAVAAPRGSRPTRTDGPVGGGDGGGFRAPRFRDPNEAADFSMRASGAGTAPSLKDEGRRRKPKTDKAPKKKKKGGGRQWDDDSWDGE